MAKPPAVLFSVSSLPVPLTQQEAPSWTTVTGAEIPTDLPSIPVLLTNQKFGFPLLTQTAVKGKGSNCPQHSK